MKVTSKEANKLLKQLESDYNVLLGKEEMGKTFLAAVNEDVESCRPDYDYEKVQKELSVIETKIIKLKHAINKFNTTTIVDGLDMTIDEVLIYIPQLTQRKNKLDVMMRTMPKERALSNMRSTIIDYRYTNYDINKAKEDYDATSDELAKVQIALDTTNVTKQFDIEL